MRKRTIMAVSYVLGVALAYGVTFLGRAAGWRSAEFGFVIHVMAGLFLAPLIALPLTMLNRHLLAFRKARGRDIEEEEKYEHEETGIISLRPKADQRTL